MIGFPARRWHCSCRFSISEPMQASFDPAFEKIVACFSTTLSFFS
jgi:hypothetical protein